jgi:hypothetical protein
LGFSKTKNMAIESLRDYITSSKNEDSKRHLVYDFFKEAFKGKKISFESDASRSDIYIEGQLVIELKGTFLDFIDGFYQALHYKKKGLAFSAICVITEQFIGLWKVNIYSDYLIAQKSVIFNLLLTGVTGEGRS